LNCFPLIWLLSSSQLKFIFDAVDNSMLFFPPRYQGIINFLCNGKKSIVLFWIKVIENVSDARGLTM
jgi:hypothetical protein